MHNARVKAGLSEIYYRGNHREVLERTVDSVKGEYQPEETPFVVGALAFLGRLDEAKWHLDRQLDSVPAPVFAEGQFYLGVGLCRHSHYGKAADIFSVSLQKYRDCQDERLRFFAYQGAAFFRFFCGRFRKAAEYAKVARDASLSSNFLYGKFLAADLIGHALVQSGEVARGFEQLDRAKEYARLLGSGGMLHATEASLLIYQYQFGWRQGETHDALLSLKKKREQNTYTRSSLLLEAARQCSLGGQLDKSDSLLREAAQGILAANHRRHHATLSLRYAYNHYLRGDCHQALSLVKSTRQNLNERVDRALKLQAVGFESMLLQSIHLDSEAELLAPEIERLTRFTGAGIARRIWQRRGSAIPHAPGDDILGDTLDRCAAGADWTELVNEGLLGFVPRALGISPEETLIVLRPSMGGLLVVDKGNVFLSTKGVSGKVEQILRRLSAGEVPKEELVKAIWGYSYHPGRHDPLIYSTISRVRAALGDRADWLEFTERGYRLRPGIGVKLIEAAPILNREPQESLVFEDESKTCLNSRQREIITLIASGSSVSASEYQNRFSVSRMTATRDLSQLYEGGFVHKEGRGRATRYVNLPK